MTYGALLLLLFAFQVAQVTDQPSPSATPPKEIIRIRSTPFCQVFRQNIFGAVEGLRINDAVIDRGRSVLSKFAYDSVVDQKRYSRVGEGSIGGGSIDMDDYQLGQIAFQAAQNLTIVYSLLGDPVLFPKDPQTDADRDLAVMKARLEAVADAQERSLNIINGTYESAALNSLLGRGDNSNGAMGQASIAEKTINLGDPILSPGPRTTSPPLSTSQGRTLGSSDAALPAPGSSAAPHSGSAQGHTSLFATTPVGQMYTAVDITQRQPARVEDRVDDAVMPGINRCRS
jgi:hypothetical protein